MYICTCNSDQRSQVRDFRSVYCNVAFRASSKWNYSYLSSLGSLLFVYIYKCVCVCVCVWRRVEKIRKRLICNYVLCACRVLCALEYNMCVCAWKHLRPGVHFGFYLSELPPHLRLPFIAPVSALIISKAYFFGAESESQWKRKWKWWLAEWERMSRWGKNKTKLGVCCLQ